MTDMDNPATVHAPRDRREFIAAARELRGRGLKLDDIAYTLNLTRVGVIELLREPLPVERRKVKA